MKVVYVVDKLTNIDANVDMIKNRFGGDLYFIVKANISKLFSTFGYPTHAVYNDHLAEVIHHTLLRTDLDDVVVYYNSLELSNDLLNQFISKIDYVKIVNVVPRYNAFENGYNKVYNAYVQGVFKAKDSLASPKLQYLPQGFVSELLETHFGNRMFEANRELVTNLYVEDKNESKSLKTKPCFSKFHLVPFIVALAITLALFVVLGTVGVNYWVVLLFLGFYVLDVVLSLCFKFKNDFDTRFLK